MLWPTALTATLLASLAVSSPTLHSRQQQENVLANLSLADFFAQERTIALQGVLANIGGLNSSLVEGASSGVVVASPSTLNPNYFFTWTRDSALTYIMLIDELIFGNTSLRGTIEDYTTAQAFLQTVTNPSGSLYPAGDGLGEPKFYSNLTRFDGTWGRPQRDGPALRAIAFMNLAPVLFALNETDEYRRIYWPLVTNDLLYTSQYWNQTGSDLWEEVHGNSFFTVAAQHRALVQGALLAEELGQECEHCQQADQILCLLSNNFWNETGGYITADINVNNVNRSGINADPLLAAITNFDYNATCDSVYQPCNSRVLATHKVVVDAFRNLYPINKNATAPEAILIGRYPEDTYFKGGAWPLCTFAAAELLYDAAAQLNEIGTLSIDEDSLPFFQDLYPDANVSDYTGNELRVITGAMTTYADGFVSAVQQYILPNGSISEQINTTSGESYSASKLTWSFASFITASQRRARQYPPSWGAWTDLANGNLNSSQCESSAYNATGQYLPAIAAGAPNITNLTSLCYSQVIFSVNATTSFGTNVFLAGNVSQLGGELDNADAIILPLNPGNYSSINPLWYVDIWLEAGETVEYQYILQQSNGTFTFEGGEPRNMSVGECGSGNITRVDDVFNTTTSA